MGSNDRQLVLVTGGSGFIGAHTILKCLSSNYRVRTTIRSLKREQDVRDMLVAGGATNLDDVSFVAADLSKDEGWSEAVKDCTYVLHVASPFPPGAPKHEDELIGPARDGTLRVLRAARDAGVKRVVVTSSMAAVAYGHKDHDASKPFTEEDWSDPDGPGIAAYAKSKTLAERAAWDFIEKEGKGLEMSVVNPSAVFGPALGSDNSTSMEIILRLMSGSLPACPQLHFTFVDVRDVADLHLLAMTSPKANNERFLAVSPPGMTMQQLSLALREKLGNAARRAPTRELPNFLLRVIAFFDPAVALILPELGKEKLTTYEKAQKVLGWTPRSGIDSAVASAESLLQLGLIKP